MRADTIISGIIVPDVTLKKKVDKAAYRTGEALLGVASRNFSDTVLQGNFETNTRRVNRNLKHIERYARTAARLLRDVGLGNNQTAAPIIATLEDADKLIQSNGTNLTFSNKVKLEQLGRTIANSIRTTHSGKKDDASLTILDSNVLDILNSQDLKRTVDAIDSILEDTTFLQRSTSRSIRFMKGFRHPTHVLSFKSPKILKDQILTQDIPKLDPILLKTQISDLFLAKAILEMDNSVRQMLKLGKVDEAANIAENFHETYLKEQFFRKMKNRVADGQILYAAVFSTLASINHPKYTNQFKMEASKSIEKFLSDGEIEKAAQIAVGFALTKTEVESFGSGFFLDYIQDKITTMLRENKLDSSWANWSVGSTTTQISIIRDNASEVRNDIIDAVNHLKKHNKLDKETIAELNAKNIRFFTLCNVVSPGLQEGDRTALEQIQNEINEGMDTIAEKLGKKTTKLRLKTSDIEELKVVYGNSSDGQEFQLMLMSKVKENINVHFSYYAENEVDIIELLSKLAELKDASLWEPLLPPQPAAPQVQQPQPAQSEAQQQPQSAQEGTPQQAQQSPVVYLIP
jgi:hypothetical protein